MDMVIIDSNFKRWNYNHFAIIKGNKLYVSKYGEYADEIEQLANENLMPFIWQAFSDNNNLAPNCVRNQEPRYKDFVHGFGWKSFYEFDLDKIPCSWKWAAERYIEENSQDVHSKEYLNWIEDRSVFYNNGFYDYAKKNGCMLSSLKAIKACVGKKYKELYSVHEHKHDTYSEMDAWATAAQFGNKYIIYGTGGESCGSDWMNFHLFWVYSTEAEMMETLNKDNFKYSPVKEQNSVFELFQFVSKHNLEEKFTEKLI